MTTSLKLRRRCVGFAILVACFASSAAPLHAQVYPDTGWARIERAESAGWSQAGLERVREKLTSLQTTAFMAIAGGRVLMDYGDVTRVSYLASVRKSVLSMLMASSANAVGSI